MFQILGYGLQTTSKGVAVRVAWPVFYFHARNHISRTAEARVAKFWTQVEYQMLALGWQTSPQWAWSGLRDPFFYIFKWYGIVGHFGDDFTGQMAQPTV